MTSRIPKKKFYQPKNGISFSILLENICWWCSLEACQWHGSNEHSQLMFYSRNKLHNSKFQPSVLQLCQKSSIFRNIYWYTIDHQRKQELSEDRIAHLSQVQQCKRFSGACCTDVSLLYTSQIKIGSRTMSPRELSHCWTQLWCCQCDCRSDN